MIVGILLESTYFIDENIAAIPGLEINYLHIGKCGGTTVRRRLCKSRINRIFHQSRPRINVQDSSRYFFFLRHPLTRLASAFSHCRDVALFPTDNIDPFSLNIGNCPAPVRIKNKILNSKKFAYSEEFEKLLFDFPDLNAVGESLSSPNQCLRNNAISLLEFPRDNIFRGIGWYLHSGRFVKKNRSKIFFVGASEWMQEGLEILRSRFSLLKPDSFSLNGLARKSTNNMHDKNSLLLSSQSRKALLNFLEDSDMRAIRSLRKACLISEELYDYYVI